MITAHHRTNEVIATTLADIGASSPEVTFVKLRNTAGSIEGSWEVQRGSSFRPAGSATSDFSATSAPNGVWQLGPG